MFRHSSTVSVTSPDATNPFRPFARRMGRAFTAAIVATLLTAVCAVGLAQDAATNEAAVRFAYLLPGGPNLDVRLQNTILHPGLIAQTVSGYFMVEAGERAFEVVPVAGTSVPGEPASPDVSEEQIATRIEASLEPGTYTTILITGTLSEVAPPTPPQVVFDTSVLTDDFGGLPRAGATRVRAVNASLDTPPLEVALQRQEVGSDQSDAAELVLPMGSQFGFASAYETLVGDRYRLVVRADGNTTLELPDLRLDSGLLYTVYVSQGGSIATVSVDAGVTLEVP